jgi:hypothetical protein
MKRKKANKPTINDIVSVLDQMQMQMMNIQQGMYDSVEIITSYIEMKNDTKKFAEFRSSKLGSAIESDWKIVRICKSLKNKVVTAIKNCCKIK